MRRHNKTLLQVLLFITALTGLITCTNPSGQAGTATETENVSAMLYNPDGTPAKHATVRFYKFGVDPRTGLAKRAAAVDSTTTDDNGNYTASLDSGTYNILASLNTNASFQDSITVIEGDTTTPPPDTLRSLGGINGKIELQGADDPRTVFVLFMGSNTFTTVSDVQGNFAATDMAKGKYRVKLLTTLDDYEVMDTSFVITAGVDSVMPEPIVMKYTGIPVVKGLSISYDTLKQIVTLTWNKPTAGRTVAGYDIYRKFQSTDSSYVKIKSDLLDTVFRDSTGLQDQSYSYQVAAVDTQGTEGTKSTVIGTKIVSAFELLKTIPFNGNDPFRFAIDKDTNFYIANRSPAYVKIINSNGDSIKTIGAGKLSQIYGIALDSRGNIYAADPDGNKVLRFSPQGDSIFQLNVPQPMDIAIDKNDNIFVVYSNYYKVGRFDTLGIMQDSLILSYQTGRLIQNIPGSIYLVDPSNSAINVYNSNLTAPSIISNIPSSMLRAIDKQNNLYFEKYRLIGQSEVDDIIITDFTGQVISKWGYFNMLIDMKIIDDKIYLLNYNETPWAPQIQIFSTKF